MKWEPISTAPKDGSEILAWYGQMIFLASWIDAQNAWLTRGNGIIFPIRWMPLPEPPEDV